MAVEFSSSVTYALQKLGTPDLVLKPEQRTAINAVYNGRDVFVWLPTGFGKSLCFHTLPFVFDYKLALTDVSAVLVITPLIALMVDQVRSRLAEAMSEQTADCDDELTIGPAHYVRHVRISRGKIGACASPLLPGLIS